jgi:hypothetical protein
MEHIRQGLLTLHTVLSGMRPPRHVGEERAEAMEVEAAAPQRTFFVGQNLDVKDTANAWLEATVLDVDYQDRKVFVTYNGWPPRWNEWIRQVSPSFHPPTHHRPPPLPVALQQLTPHSHSLLHSFDSPRLAPFRTRTLHSSFSPFLSPTPVTPLREAPVTGTDDVRWVVPEVRSMLQRVDQYLGELTELCEEGVDAREAEGGREQEVRSGAYARLPWRAQGRRRRREEGSEGEGEREGEQESAERLEADRAPAGAAAVGAGHDR